MLDETFTPPKYVVNPIAESEVYDFARLGAMPDKSITVTDSEKSEILELFNSLSIANKMEVVYRLFRCQWDSRLLGEYRGIEVAKKVCSVLLSPVVRILACKSGNDNCDNTNT